MTENNESVQLKESKDVVVEQKDTLREDILYLLKGDKFSDGMVNRFTEDIRRFTENDNFRHGLDLLCDILFVDRNSDGVLDGKDLDALYEEFKYGFKKGDFNLYIDLITCVGLLAISVPKMRLELNDNFERLFIKIMVYALFVEMPRRTNSKFTTLPEATKEKVVDVLLAIYKFMKTSSEVAMIFERLNVTAKNATYRVLGCCVFHKQNIIDPIIIDTAKSLRTKLGDVAEKIELRRRIEVLESTK